MVLTSGMQSREQTRPLLRWAGSKRLQMPLLRRFWPERFERYVEPFCGSCAALFGSPAVPALMNDLNSELVNFWRHVASVPESLQRRVSCLPNDPEVYYSLRSTDPGDLDPEMRAVRFLYLNRYSFNGLYRTNRWGRYNVPYGGRRCGSVPDESTFVSISQRLQSVTFYNFDFEEFLCQSSKAGDFVYLDPPYAVDGSRVPMGYDAGGFGSSDLPRLERVLSSLSERGVKFLLSYAKDADVMSALKHFYRGKYPVQRRISGFKAGRHASEEVVFSNYAQ